MSKDPFCSKAHANDPAHLETVVVGQSGGLENVVLYISEGLTGSVDGCTNVSAGIRSKVMCYRIAEILGDRKHAQPRKNSH